MNMPFHIIIPARLNSTRLPKKMLQNVEGKPLIQRTYEQALLSPAASVTIATDCPDIAKVAKQFGAPVCITKETHQNGTERLAEAVQKLNLKPEDIVVNIQGDEPLVPPRAVLQTVLAMEAQANASTTTLCTSLTHAKHFEDPNVVKVVLDKNGFAMYFSRSPIPYPMALSNELNNVQTYRHLGLYAYRVKTLQRYCYFEPSPLEITERLEQLRLLYQGEKIHVSIIEETLPPGVDTYEDLEEVRKYFETQK